MKYYCTLFDVNYLPNFLALHESLKDKAIDFKIYAFCMDESSFQFLAEDYKQSSIVPVSLSQLIAFFPELENVKKQRSIVEFYFTCSPFICTYVMSNNPTCSHVVYLDADLYFFGSPQLVFDELEEASVGIIEHKFYGWGKRYVKYGKFNVGLVVFKNDDIGKACLKFWLTKCEEWCFDYYDEINMRFGDQKYLDEWETKFNNVKIIKQKGANLAPWNVGQYSLTVDNSGAIFIDKEQLVFYHFASFKQLEPNLFTTSMSRYFARPSKVLKLNIYTFYLKKLAVYSTIINNSLKLSDPTMIKKNRNQIYKNILKKQLTDLATNLRRWILNDYIHIN